MLKKALLLFTILLFTGCVERGYELTVNQTTKTVTAVKTVDICDKSQDNTKNDIKKMNTAVNKEQKKQAVPITPIIINTSKKPVETKTTKNEAIVAKEKTETIKLEKEKSEIAAKKQQAEKKRLKAEKENQIKQERKALEAKLSLEKEKKHLEAETQREALLKKEESEKKVQEEKILAMKAMKEKKAQEALKLKLEKEKAEQIFKMKAEKVALERKIAKEKQLQIKKEKKEKAALERKLAEEKKQRVVAEKAEKTRKQKEEALRLADIQKEKEAQRLSKIKEEKALQARKISQEKKTSMAKTEALIFKPSTQTYQKFGTSEIHGHVVYLTPAGQEIALQNTKIYLVPKNTKTDYWYNNYYLKNKEASSLSKTVVRYMNATHLNLEKNFAFYGLATGTYYIIIESSYPPSIAKNKKVYIAKKISVERYKKIMTVFSKKL